MPLRDLLAFRRVLSELFGSGLHVRPPSHRCGRRNAKRFTDHVMGVTASLMIQPISERFRTRKGFRSLRGDDVALRPRRKATPEWRASPNAAIAGSLPCAARLTCPPWPLAHIQGRPSGATDTL